MSRPRIHLELVGAMRTRHEVGQLQRARLRGRPLLTGCGSFRHGLAVTEPAADGLRLRCRTAEDARQAAALARRALDTLAPVRDLLGAPPDRVVADGTGVRVDSVFPGYLVHRLLDSAKAVPDAADGPAPVDFVECSGPDAIAAFERGDLQATAPSSFEIARDRASDPRFRHLELDLYALLLLGPGGAGRRAIVPGRRLLRDRLAAEPELAGPLAGLVEDRAPDPVAGPPRTGASEAELLYADFWPNAVIVRQLCAGLAELGTVARPRAVPLDEVRARTAAGSFELALVLANGYAGPRLSVPLTLARSAATAGPAMTLEPLRTALATALAGPEEGAGWPAVTAAALRRVPAVALARLRGGSLLDPSLPDLPPAYGCVLALEHYAGGCRA